VGFLEKHGNHSQCRILFRRAVYGEGVVDAEFCQLNLFLPPKKRRYCVKGVEVREPGYALCESGDLHMTARVFACSRNATSAFNEYSEVEP